MAEKNTPKAEKVETKQVQAVIPLDVFLDLEGYAFGTRRKPSQVVREAILEYYDNHKAEISARKVD